MNKGSIDLARRLCYEIAGPTDEEDDMSGSDYGSVDIAEILSAEVERLRASILSVLPENWEEDADWVRLLEAHGLTPNAEIRGGEAVPLD